MPVLLDGEEDDQNKIVLSNDYNTDNTDYEDFGHSYDDEQVEENFLEVQEQIPGTGRGKCLI